MIARSARVSGSFDAWLRDIATRASGVLLGVVVSAAGATAALAGAMPPDYGLSWRTIGDPGNRPTTLEEMSVFPELHSGAVGYTYRLTTTELTNQQWLEFVNAYAPYSGYPVVATAFTGPDISFGGPGQPYVLTGNAAAPARMSWDFAARYCNWLCNGKSSELAAFNAGAYDVSTFTKNPDGTYNHQQAHTPGAQFWIPTEDEWVKGAYWDPNKMGSDGVPGAYWLNLGMSDVPLIPGLPSQGGQTNAGLNLGPNIPTSVDSYPSVLSPWGLLDTSGGASEYTESSSDLAFNGFRKTRGSQYRGPLFSDRLDAAYVVSGLGGAFAGLRVASIPSPGPMVAPGFAILLFARRSRRQSLGYRNDH